MIKVTLVKESPQNCTKTKLYGAVQQVLVSEYDSEQDTNKHN
jgi:hypothetical protein